MKKMIQMMVAVLALCAMSAQAATWTNYAGSATATGLPGNMLGGHYVLQNTIDCSSLSGIAANDSIQMIVIPPGTLVTAVGYAISTFSTNTTAQFNVGDSSATNAWLTSQVSSNVAVAGVAASTWGCSVLTTSKFYNAANYISLQPQTADSKLKITVKAICTSVANK